MAKSKPAKGKKEKAPMIAKDELGSLTAIAKRQGGMKKDGSGISRAWMRKKMKDPRTKASTKKKINFALNMNKKK